jgi:uncharacterized protein (DUF433 family)
MDATEYPHIERRPDGLAYVTGTQTKVLEIVLDRLAHHWDADEIHRQHPHLSLGQLYCALAYYCDHHAEIDRQIETRESLAREIFDKLGPSPLRASLKARGLIP